DARVHGEHDDVRVAARGEVEQPGPARPSVDRLQVDDLAADRGVDGGELVRQPRGHGSRAALLPRNALLLQGAGIVAWTAMDSIAELLGTGEPLVLPGVYDALSAMLAELAGFPVIFLSGYCLSATRLAQPDLGLLTQTEVIEAARRIISAVDRPLIVDIDTGYGNAFNVERTIDELIRIGAAGAFLEDQVWPKRCGHMARKRVV